MDIDLLIKFGTGVAIFIILGSLLKLTWPFWVGIMAMAT